MSIKIEVPVPEGEPTGLEVILHPTESNSVVQLRQIQRYVQERLDGASAKTAAKAAGTTVGSMKLQGKQVQAYLAQKRAEYTATAEDIRELVVLKWVEKALTATDERAELLALNELSKIPEVGLKGGKAVVGAPAAQSLSPETEAVLEALDIQEGD